MKKSTKKIVKHLTQYVGYKMLRTKPTFRGDWSYTEGDPILLVGFTSDGCIRYRHTGDEAEIFENEEFVLPISFTDYSWITYKKALRAKSNALNKWMGKRIRRIRPTNTNDHSFMYGSAPTLISASKHHMVIMYNDIWLEGLKIVLNSEFINPDDWELAE